MIYICIPSNRFWEFMGRRCLCAYRYGHGVILPEAQEIDRFVAERETFHVEQEQICVGAILNRQCPRRLCLSEILFRKEVDGLVSHVSKNAS